MKFNKQTMKNDIKYITNFIGYTISFFILSTVWVLCMAFITNETNPIDWHWTAKSAFVLIEFYTLSKLVNNGK